MPSRQPRHSTDVLDHDGPGTSADTAVVGAAPRLHALTLRVLIERIRSGAIPTGTILLESRLASQFRISRAPVRRALAELLASGLVVACEGRGFKVVGAPDASPVGAPDDAPGPISAEPTWARLIGEVRANILARSPVATWRINEAKLAEHYGVSRTVAREVLAHLHERSIVRRDEKLRWYIQKLTFGYVEELYELRVALEPVALRKAATRLDSDVLMRALERFDRLEEGATLDGRDLLSSENDLHVDILEACGNATMLNAIRRAQAPLLVHVPFFARHICRGGTPPSIREHREIISELSAGRVDAAAALLAEHLRASATRFDSALRAVWAEFEKLDRLSYLEAIDA